MEDDYFEIISNDEFIFGIVDKDLKLVLGIRHDGTLFNLDPTISNLKHHPAFSSVNVTSNSEFMFAMVDRDNNVLFGKRYDGTTYDSDDSIKKLINQIKTKKDDVFYTSNPFPTTSDFENLTEGCTLINTIDGDRESAVIQKSKYVNGKLSSWYLPKPLSSLNIYTKWIADINDSKRDVIEFAVNEANLLHKDSIMGFLHHRLLDDDPVRESFESPLKISYLRYGSGLNSNDNNNPGIIRKKYIQKALDRDIKVIFVISDIIVQKNFVNNIGNTLEQVDILYEEWGNSIIYDIWNEPNLYDELKGNEDVAFYLINRIYDHLRSKRDGASLKLIAPSISILNIPYLQRFLDYCRTHNMVIDYLAWHHNMELFEHDLTKMEEDIQEILHLANTYKDVIREGIMCPEIQTNDTVNPASAIIQLALFDKYNIPTCRTCSHEELESGDIIRVCNDDSLDGLLLVNPIISQVKERTVWYAYKFYSDSIARRGQTIKSNNLVGGFSWAESDNIHAVVGGYKYDIENFSIYFSYINSIVKDVTAVTVEIQEYINSGYAAFGNRHLPPSVSTRAIIREGGVIVVSIPSLKAGNLYKIKISK